jgi:hypothetical protein
MAGLVMTSADEDQLKLANEDTRCCLRMMLADRATTDRRGGFFLLAAPSP